MANLWMKIKLGLIALVVLYLFAFAIMNARQQVDVWLFVGQQLTQVSALVLMLFVFLLGVLGTLLTRTVLATLRQLRTRQERERTDRLEREIKDMKDKAGRLQTRPGEGPGQGHPG
jgi:uncharacterized integral membrane protein